VDDAAPYEPLRTLPASWYTTEATLELERDRIFERTWQSVPLTGRLDAPGSFVTTTVGRVPVVVVRGKDGLLRAFVNVCRHRGSEVVVEREGCRKTLQCPYHAWTYDLDGTLRSAPRMRDEPDFDPAEHSLEELRLESVGPFVFVCADPDAEPLASAAGAWPALLAETELDLDRLVHRERRTYDVAANWKVLVENFLECYHCPTSHHAFTELVDLGAYEGEVHSDAFWHFSAATRSSALTRDLHGIAGLPDARRRLWNFVLWPSFMANVYPGPGNVSTNAIVPLAPDRTLAIYDFWFDADVSEDEQRENVAFVDLVQREDIALCESVQRGLRSGRIERGRLLESERFLDRFAWQVARAVAGDVVPPRSDAGVALRL
jgi:choline monooxygenase